MRFYVRKRRQPPAIIIVALIDILIVLLIFLLVTTTFNQQPAVKLALPESSTAQKSGASDSPPLVISIDPQGVLRFGPDASPVSHPAEADTVDDLRGQIGRLDATAKSTLADRWKASKLHNLDQLQADEVETVREMLRAVAVESFRSASDTPAAPTAPAPASEALSEPLDASVVDADHQLAVARESVAGLPARGIDKALSDRALITSGGIEFRRERLAKALASEAAMPEVEG